MKENYEDFYWKFQWHTDAWIRLNEKWKKEKADMNYCRIKIKDNLEFNLMIEQFVGCPYKYKTECYS